MPTAASSLASTKQDALNKRFEQVAGLCTTAASCHSIQRTGKAAVLRHPAQFEEGQHCFDPQKFTKPCDDRWVGGQLVWRRTAGVGVPACVHDTSSETL